MDTLKTCEIIDAHVHLPVGEGMEQRPAQRKRLLKEMMLNGVDGCIVIADSELESAIGTNEECIGLFSGDDHVYVIAGISPDIDYSAQMQKAERLLAERKVVGLKLFTGHEAFCLTDDRLNALYDLAERYDVPVLFHSGWDNSQYGAAPYARQVAMQRPGMKLVCCHCWYPKVEMCAELTELLNVYFDLSSVADDPSILPEIAEKAKTLIEAAPGRVLFGSDYSGCSVAAHVKFLRSLQLSPEQENLVFSGNAKALYRLK